MAYTDRQIELVRGRLEAFYDVESRGPRKVTWGGICNDIYAKTNVDMDTEVLRQFVRRVERRGVPRLPSAENLEGIVLYLIHPDIDLLSREELQEPDIPFLLARLLLEYLRPDEHSQMLFPPRTLAGKFHAVHRSADRLSGIDVELTLQLVDRNHVIRLAEKTEIYSYAPEVTHTEVLSAPARILQNRRTSQGWAILTPEDNLFMFMKQKPYATNYYYTTIAISPGFWSPIHHVRQLVLLRHQYPVQCDSIPESLGGLLKEAEADLDTMFLRFNDTTKVVDADFEEVVIG